MIRLIVLVALALAGLVVPAAAHPHIFIDAKATIVFDPSGAVSTIRNRWTFDEEFSAWVIQGLDTNGDGVTSTPEMQDLANDNLKGLQEYDYYTYAGEGGTNLAFVKGSEATMRYEGGRVTLDFAVAAKPAYRIGKQLELAINDPEYYVAITFAGPEDVTLENAPAGCIVTLDPPKEMPQSLQDQLYALGPDVVQLPTALAQAMRGVQGAILVTCPKAAAMAEVAAPATALDAVNLIGDARPIPFNGPPPEPGLPLGRSGVLGWIADMQKQFYAEMSATLGALRRDNNAFWLLGGLSFLYGIFHAAGPGHGKVVISSYVLANEQQLRRGVLLSFISAMIQSIVAVVFVLVAASVLQLSSMAMSRAANWIGIASYAMVALLGAWLVLRKLLFSHDHDHSPRATQGDKRLLARAHLYGAEHDHHAHHGHHHHAGDDDNHDHDEDAHGHVHVVTADKVRGGWREQLAVVLGVGLRPCSGALVVLVFALSQGVMPAGIAAVFLMGLGTAITVAVLATMAAGAKGLVLRVAGSGGGAVAGIAVWWLELAGAVAVLAFGVLLLLASL